MSCGEMYPRASSSSSMNRCQSFQYVPARLVHHHDREDVRLAGLDQRERLERLVVGAEPAGEQHDRVRLLDEHQLAGEEVPHGA